jgi:hypothetical protein
VGFLAQSAAAVESGETAFSPLPPLLITAYQTVSGGKDIAYVELYNTSKQMVQVGDWTIHDAANNRDLIVSSSYSGMMEPGSHVIAARAGVVTGATYTINGWNTAGSGAVLTSLQLMANGYRTLDALLSTKTAERDMAMARTYNTESYSTAASPFVPNYRVAPQPFLFDDGLYMAPENPGLSIVEIYPYASGCSPFDTSVLCGDYIKLFNPTTQSIQLDGMVLRTDSSSSSRTSSNTFALGGSMAPGEYKTIWLSDSGARISLTNSGGYIWLEDVYATVVPYEGSVVHYASAGASEQGFSYALGSEGAWQWTSTPSPLGENSVTVPETEACPEGKYRSLETNRCRTLEDTLNVLTACDEGSERNPLTNRCRKISSGETASLTACKEGQERNPETNRCRSIASAVAELLPCDEGYERNPATNRCRKVRDTNVLGAGYPVEPYNEGANAAASWWVIGGIAVLALGYAGWEWRREIAIGFTRVTGAFTSGK